MRKHSGMCFIVDDDNDLDSSFIRKSRSAGSRRMMMDEIISRLP